MCNEMQSCLAKAEAAIERAERGAARLAEMYAEVDRMYKASEKRAAESRSLRELRETK